MFSVSEVIWSGSSRCPVSTRLQAEATAAQGAKVGHILGILPNGRWEERTRLPYLSLQTASPSPYFCGTAALGRRPGRCSQTNLTAFEAGGKVERDLSSPEPGSALSLSLFFMMALGLSRVCQPVPCTGVLHRRNPIESNKNHLPLIKATLKLFSLQIACQREN